MLSGLRPENLDQIGLWEYYVTKYHSAANWEKQTFLAPLLAVVWYVYSISYKQPGCQNLNWAATIVCVVAFLIWSDNWWFIITYNKLTCFLEESGKRVISWGFITGHSAIRSNSMFKTIELPTWVANLDSSLSNMHWQTLSRNHDCL